MNALPDPSDGKPSPEALPPQLNPTANLRALSAEEAHERLSQVPAPKLTPPQGSPRVEAPPAPVAAPRRPFTGYAAAAFVAALAVLAAVLLWRA